MGSGRALVPGAVLALCVSATAIALGALEARFLGSVVVEPLVLAILLGMLVRALWTIPASFEPGIEFGSQRVLEVAVALLGLSVDLPTIVRAGPALAIGIPLFVLLGISAGFLVGRLCGLPRRLSLLIACGNGICGNSAIAAVASVIGAEREHIASAIAFTAIVGVLVVIGLPFLASPLGLSEYRYGAFAGLTVYAVPQVLAATLPVGTLAAQVGTFVKLVRVLMLGPVILVARWATYRRDPAHARAGARLAGILPWFILGFLFLALLRSVGLIPDGLAGIGRRLSGALTLIAMGTLGLGVDLRRLRDVGMRVAVAVSLSLVALMVLALGLTRVLGVG